jgi:hypothetical protein
MNLTFIRKFRGKESELMLKSKSENSMTNKKNFNLNTTKIDKKEKITLDKETKNKLENILLR